jgi:uncharacterized protein YndB with AHSA1/START domain
LADRRFRTVDQPVKDVWDFLTSTEGTGLWLGQRGSRSYVATARMRVLLRCTGGGQAGSANVDQDGPIWPAQ